VGVDCTLGLIKSIDETHTFAVVETAKSNDEFNKNFARLRIASRARIGYHWGRLLAVFLRALLFVDVCNHAMVPRQFLHNEV
jgi:hypothetical protein